MSPFELDGEGRLVHLNAKKEGPADGRVLACDLKIAATISNDILISFHGKLRLMMFDQDGEPRFSKMGAVEWDHAFRGMVVAMKQPDNTTVQFIGVTVKDFTFFAKKGGKVELQFKAQVKPDKGQFEALGQMLLADGMRLTVHNADGELFNTEDSAAAAARALHETAKADNATITVLTTDGAGNVTDTVTLGALTPEITAQMKTLGSAEAAKHEDDRDFERGIEQAYKTLGLSKQFVDEYLAELQDAYTQGWESVPADL